MRRAEVPAPLAALLSLAALLLAAPAPPVTPPQSGELTLIHLGDLHARLVPMPAACDGRRGTVGGLARVATVVRRIRQRAAPGRSLLVSTGDAVQGSAEALFTRGEAAVRAIAPLGVDAHAPGNWDFVYGPAQFLETFAGAGGRAPLAPWPAIAANLYLDDSAAGAAPRRPLPPYRLVRAGGLVVGIIGLTTTRGLPAVGAAATRGFRFTGGDDEVAHFARLLREREGADVVVLASELGLAANVRLAERLPGAVDVILSSDSHETTPSPIVAGAGTLVVEVGASGSAVGELVLRVAEGQVAGWRWTLHPVTDAIPDDPEVAAIVDSVRAPFLSGVGFQGRRQNPLLAGARLIGPLDRVVGRTTVALHRRAHSGAAMPGVVEGTSHDFLADALRAATRADAALLRGFRFGGCVAPGPVTVGDLYDMLPIGAGVARAGPVPAARLREQVERALGGVFDPDPRRWAGGWAFAYAGLSFDLDAAAPTGARAAALPLADSAAPTVAGLWFPGGPNVVSGCERCGGGEAGAPVAVLRAADGAPLDAVDVAARYLGSLPGRGYAPGGPRITLRRPLPPAPHGWPVVQPFAGGRSPSAADQPPQ